MFVKILQNINFSIEAFCRLCVALISISPTSICILTYIDSVLLSQKTLAHLLPDISPIRFPLDISPTIPPDMPSRVDPLLSIDIDCITLAISING